MRIITGSLPNDCYYKTYNIDLKFSLLRQRMPIEQAVETVFQEMEAIDEDSIYSSNPMFFNYIEVVLPEMVDRCYYISSDNYLIKITDNVMLAEKYKIMHLGEVIEDSEIIWWHK